MSPVNRKPQAQGIIYNVSIASLFSRTVSRAFLVINPKCVQRDIHKLHCENTYTTTRCLFHFLRATMGSLVLDWGPGAAAAASTLTASGGTTITKLSNPATRFSHELLSNYRLTTRYIFWLLEAPDDCLSIRDVQSRDSARDTHTGRRLIHWSQWRRRTHISRKQIANTVRYRRNGVSTPKQALCGTAPFTPL